MSFISGVALNPQNIVPLDPTISTLSYSGSIVPPYQNVSSGNYTVYINSQSDLYLQTSDRGNLSNIGYFNTSTIADTLLGSSNLAWMYQTKNDSTYFPLTTRTTPFTVQARQIAYNGTIYVAVGSGSNNIATSYDGISWVPRGQSLFGTTGGWSVAWNGSYWLVGGSNTAILANIMARSTDGVIWTGVQNYVFNNQPTKIGWNGSLLVCGQTNGDSIVYTSTDAISWVRRSTSVGGARTAVWNGSVWIVPSASINTGAVSYSYDGISWPVVSSGINANTYVNGAAYSPTLGVWVIVGYNNTAVITPQFYYSYNILSWTSATPSANGVAAQGQYDVIWDGAQFLSVGTSSGSEGCYTSPNGITWTLRASTTGITTPRVVVYSSSLGLYLAGGTGGTIMASSPTGVTWTQRGSGIFTAQVNDVKWNGTMFVAVGSGTNTIAYSYDGVNWIGLGATYLTFTVSGNGVVWAAELGLWVASGDGTNQILTSPDGINWTPRSGTGPFQQVSDLAWSPSKNLWVATGVGTHALATSTDAITWTPRTGLSLFSTRGYAVMWSSVHNLFIAGGQGTNTILTSPDGITWTARTSPMTTTVQGFGFNGSRYVAVGSGTNVFATSDDGITWTGQGSSGITTSGQSVAWSPSLSLWVATGSGTNAFATSPDGVTWTGYTGTGIFSTSGYGIHWNTTLSQFVAGGQGTNTLATSQNGTDWLGFTGLLAIMGNVFVIAWNGTIWIVGGATGNQIATSPDGITWTGRTSVITSAVNGLAWNGAQWVAVGSGTNIFATSPDGITWTGRGSTGITGVGFDVIWAPYQSLWVAVGSTTNSIATSPDGVTWTGRTTTTIFSTSGYALASYRNLIVAGGIGTNSIATSVDGITWTGRGVSALSTNCRGIAYSPTLNLWVAVGAGTNSIATSTNGTTWTGRTGNTIFGTATNTQGWDVTWNGTYFTAVGGTSLIATSTDGITWKVPANLTPTPTTNLLSIAYRPPIMVAGGTGTNTLAYSIDDGYSWIPRGALIFTTSCTGIAWNGLLFVAVGLGTNTIATSPDGITWTGRGATIFSTQGNDVLWAEGLKLWVAVGAGTNVLATSPDGITWTGRGSGGSSSIFSTAGDRLGWSGSLLVALGRGGNTVAYSRDGIVWTVSGSPVTAGASAAGGLAWNGNVWVAVTNGATNIWTSPNAITWTSRATLTAGNGQAVGWNGYQFLVTGTSTRAATSPDGFTWTSLTGPAMSGGAFRVTWNHTSTQWTAVGVDTGTNIQTIMTSPDAVTWAARATYPPMTSSVRGATWASSLGLWVAVGGATANIVSSTDGTTWIQRVANSLGTANCVAWNGSLFVAGGGTTVQIFTSPDGITWTSRTNGGVTWTVVNGVAWSSALSIWVAVGANTTTSGVIATSANGTTWTSRSTTIFGATGAGNAVAVNAAGNLFVAVGTVTNVFATSSDGVTWTGRGSTGITTAGRGVVWVPSLSLWVAVGNGTNSIATSPNGVTWTGRTTTLTFSTQGNQVATNNSIIVATGQGTNTLAYSYDGINWTGLGAQVFTGGQGGGIAWNSTTGQWVAGSYSGQPFFATSPDGQNWMGRTVFSTNAFAIDYQLQREKTYTIQNTHWTGRSSQQTFRILSS